VQPPAGEAHIDTEPSRADRQARMVYDKFRPGGPATSAHHISYWRTFSEPPPGLPAGGVLHRSVGNDEACNVLYIVDKIPRRRMFAPMPDAPTIGGGDLPLQPQAPLGYFSGMARERSSC